MKTLFSKMKKKKKSNVIKEILIILIVFGNLEIKKRGAHCFVSI